MLRSSQLSSAVSGLVHGAALALLGGVPIWVATEAPKSPGVRLAVTISSAASELVPPQEMIQSIEIDSHVVVMPRRVEIDRQRFIPTEQLPLPPKLVDLAAHSVPAPPSLPSISSDRSEPTPKPNPARPPAIPRRQPPIPREAAVASMPRSLGTEQTRSPTPRHNPPPNYPRQAQLEGRQGSVLLRITVATDGRVASVAVHKTSGHPVLDAAAVSAVSKWRFEPARRGDQAVEATVLLPVRFKLD